MVKKKKIFSLSQTPVFFQFIQNEAILTKIWLFLFLLSKKSKLLIKNIKTKWKSKMDSTYFVEFNGLS